MKRIALLAAALALAGPAAAQNAYFNTDTKLTIQSTTNALALGGNECIVGFGVNGSALIAGAGVNVAWSAEWCRKAKVYAIACLHPAHKTMPEDCPELRRQLVAVEFTVRGPDARATRPYEYADFSRVPR